MKKYLFLLLVIALAQLSSCQDESDLNIDNINGNLKQLAKYPTEVIQINAHNYFPKLIGLKRNNIPQTRGVYKDSLWEDRFGKTIFATSDETVLLPNNHKLAFPGSILKGNSIEEMKLTSIYAQTKPITISVSFPTMGGGISKTLQPSLSGMRNFINEALSNKIGSQPASLSFSIDYFKSYSELRTAFGSSIKTGALFWKNKQESYEENYKISKRTGLYIKYIQRNFTIDMDLPQDGSLIKGTIAGENYSPIYINSVTFGRMGILTIETDSLSDYAYSKFSEISKKLFVNKKTNFTQEEKNILEEATMKLFLLAPGGSEDVYNINTPEQLANLLNMNNDFTKESPGVPIYCSYAYLSDNSPVEIKYQYNITSDPLYVRVGSRNNSATTGNWPDTPNINSYVDVLFAFFRDKECKIPAVPSRDIKFNIRVKTSRVQYKWNTPSEAWGSITKEKDAIGFVQNNFRETEMVAYQKLLSRVGVWSIYFEPNGDYFNECKRANIDCINSFLVLEKGEFYQPVANDWTYKPSNKDYTNGDSFLNEIVQRNNNNWGNRPDGW